MVRTIVSHPSLAGAPLDELKQFLSITVSRDDGLLEQILHSAHALCENFTGLTLLATVYDETVNASSSWQKLTTRPIVTVLEARLVDAMGLSEPLADSDYEHCIAADGSMTIRLRKPTSKTRLVARVSAQTADGWEALPADLRHGLIRLAAHNYRERDSGPLAQPPASVAALWRPHRQIRL